MNKRFKCNYCKQTVVEYPATSRKDSVTEICAACATKEAIEDYIAYREKNENERLERT